MIWWRVSKYNPALRDRNGRYLEDEWTSFGDVGKAFSGVVLTLDAYLGTESSMLSVAEAFHKDAGEAPLTMIDVEVREAQRLEASTPLTEGRELVGWEEVRAVVQASLREQCWCRLEAADKRHMIHFGYDYYLYFGGVHLPSVPLVAESLGLFCERHTSPYVEP